MIILLHFVTEITVMAKQVQCKIKTAENAGKYNWHTGVRKFC